MKFEDLKREILKGRGDSTIKQSCLVLIRNAYQAKNLPTDSEQIIIPPKVKKVGVHRNQ